MEDRVWRRTLEEADYCLNVQGATIAEVARRFDVSESTVRRDLTNNLARINPQLHNEVRKRLMLNQK